MRRLFGIERAGSARLKSRIYIGSAQGILLACLLVCWHIQAQPVRESAPAVTLVLSPGDHPDLLRSILTFSHNWDWEIQPVLAAMEPGPLILKGGIKLLPNQIPPRLTIPDILIISNMGDLEINMQFMALVRRVLRENGKIWVVGDSFPHDLASMPLPPGSRIKLIALNDLGKNLSHNKPTPHYPFPHFFPFWR